MNKFKTVNDLRRRDVMVANCPDETDYDIVEADKLKQSGIQDIKAIHKIPMDDDYFECITLSESPKATVTTIEAYIRWKFNLKEEDLK